MGDALSAAIRTGNKIILLQGGIETFAPSSRAHEAGPFREAASLTKHQVSQASRAPKKI
jgi:hypothetical protein